MDRSRNKQDNDNSQIKRFAIYSRKSKFTEKGDSIENQINQCKELIRYQFPQAVEENIIVYEDEGYSGASINRPQFKQMMSDLRNKEFNVLVCYRLDRISRNAADFNNVLAELDRYGVAFYSKSDNFDTSTATGRAMIQMVAVFAEMERNIIAERIRDNMYDLAKTGRWLGGNTPTGYRSTQFINAHLDGGRVRKAYMLKQVPKEIDTIGLIFHKFIESESLTKVETYLMQSGVQSKNHKRYSAIAIKSILRNPVYMIADEDAWMYFQQAEVEIFSDKDSFDSIHGIMAYNKTKQKPGKANEYLAMQDWVIAVGNHEGVISGAEWTKVQSILDSNKSKAPSRPKSNNSLLSGLLFCSHCGDFMRTKSSPRFNAQGEVIFSYLCTTKEKSRSQLCQMKNPNGNELDKAVCEEVFKLAEDIPSYLAKLEDSMSKLAVKGNQLQQERETVSSNMKSKQQSIDTLLNTLAQMGDTIVVHVKDKIERLDSEIKQLQKRLDEIDELFTQSALPSNDLAIMEEALYSFKHNFNHMTLQQKHRALRQLIRRIEWDGETAHIYFLGSSDGDFELPSSDGNKEPQEQGCKRNPYELPQPTQNSRRYLYQRPHRCR